MRSEKVERAVIVAQLVERLLPTPQICSLNPVMDTDNRVAPPIPLVYWFCLQNLRRHMCCRAIKTKLIGVAASAYQCLLANFTYYQLYLKRRRKLRKEAGKGPFKNDENYSWTRGKPFKFEFFMNAPKITFVVEMVQKGKENRILKTGVMSPTPRPKCSSIFKHTFVGYVFDLCSTAHFMFLQGPVL